MAATTIESSHSGTRSLQRVMQHYLRKSRQCLSADEPADEAVHTARKAIKKSRAALRLLRPALGKRRFRRGNRALRDAAQALNPLRDAQVLLQTLSGVCRSDPALRHSRAARRLAAHLRQELSRVRDQMNARSLRAESCALQRLQRRAQHWQIGRRGWSVLGPGIRRIYRRGRQVLSTASGQPADAALHEWRKQIKYLHYSLRMLSPLQPGPLGALEQQARVIAEQLGGAHDLELLHRRARSRSSGRERSQRRLLRTLEALREQRAFAALIAGERLFQPRPRDFERALAHAWRRWRRHGSCGAGLP